MTWGEIRKESRKPSIYSGNTELLNIDSVTKDIDTLSRATYKLDKLCSQLATSKDPEKIRKQIREYKNESQKVKARIERTFQRASVRQAITADRQESVTKAQLLRLETQFKEIKKRYDVVFAKVLEKEKKEKTVRNILANEDVDENEKDDEFTKEQLQNVKKEIPIMDLDSLLTSAQSSTIDVHKRIAEEEHAELTKLETELLELNSCVVDVKEMVNEQQQALDLLDKNVQKANDSVEVAVEDIKIASNRTVVGGLQKGLDKLFFFTNIFRK